MRICTRTASLKIGRGTREGQNKASEQAGRWQEPYGHVRVQRKDHVLLVCLYLSLWSLILKCITWSSFAKAQSKISLRQLQDLCFGTGSSLSTEGCIKMINACPPGCCMGQDAWRHNAVLRGWQASFTKLMLELVHAVVWKGHKFDDTETKFVW